jgi:uncharacterized protein (DUF1499 family)
MDLKYLFLTATLALGTFLGCAGSYPTDLGVNSGRLKPCPGSPNCVSSQADMEDETHFIAPLTYTLAYTGTVETAYDTIVSIIQTMEKTAITEKDKNYIRATFTSAMMGFVDDVEFYFPEQPVIHVRSASRKGYSDFGVNRQRIETIRSLFEKAETGTNQ